MKKYKAFLDFVSNESLKVSDKLEEFTVEARDLDDAIQQVDKALYAGGVTLKPKDFVIDDEIEDETSCWISFSDSIAGLQITYEINEI
ncbi:hypothetical protein [Staphylococcus aureus]|uniref:hypothetical protein n=1 Tax=Staphylococcus aureus TaxID=1280 RepID=UPI0020C08565|nr:hypothetical protein [Staphylococcus aureus]